MLLNNLLDWGNRMSNFYESFLVKKSITMTNKAYGSIKINTV